VLGQQSSHIRDIYHLLLLTNYVLDVTIYTLEEYHTIGLNHVKRRLNMAFAANNLGREVFHIVTTKS
jgi:hypothetical protein